MTDIRVMLRCPSCGHEWHAATIKPELWWTAGLTPDTCARARWCPVCETPPPMQVVTAQQELGL